MPFKSKYDYDFIVNFFKESNATLLTTFEEYRPSIKIKFLCNCGNLYNQLIYTMLPGKIIRCDTCKRKAVEKAKLDKNGGKRGPQSEATKQRKKERCLRLYGVEHVTQTDWVKAKQRASCMQKYGVEYPSQTPEFSEKIKKTFKERYGYDYPMQVPSILAKSRATSMERYGVPCVLCISGPVSKESQKFFHLIQNKLPESIKHKSHYHEFSGEEFTVCKDGKYYQYDFVNSIAKVVIEYHGAKFHHKATQKDDEVGWCLFSPERTVKESREKEETKFGIMEDRGYTVLVVWDYEYKKDKIGTVEKCVDFILSHCEATC